MLSAFDVIDEGHWKACSNGRIYRPCSNYVNVNVCNWMVADTDDHTLCRSCRLTDTIPDLSKPENLSLWYRMESAKRHLLYTLNKLNLPVWDEKEDDEPLRFRFLEDVTEDEYGQELTVKSTIITGHQDGVITLNLKEAEHSSRVLMREKMNERYRTLVGHFRHEAGHFYWDKLIKNSPHLGRFRELFGDERQDYMQSLQRYYTNGPVADWQDRSISAYASMHPWEDWAETWAHYLHMVDTLETATDYSVALLGHEVVNPFVDAEKLAFEDSFEQIFEDWCRLTTVLNALNRSMGMDDAYPFIIPNAALDKLAFIHSLVHKRRT